MIEYHHLTTPNDIMDLRNGAQWPLKPFCKKTMKVLHTSNKQYKRKLRKQSYL